jgi:hypothetical protein
MLAGRVERAHSKRLPACVHDIDTQLAARIHQHSEKVSPTSVAFLTNMKFDECFFMYSTNTWAGNEILREILAVVCRVSVRGRSANMGRRHGAIKCEQNWHVACYLPSVCLHRCQVSYIWRGLFGKYSASAQVCRVWPFCRWGSNSGGLRALLGSQSCLVLKPIKGWRLERRARAGGWAGSGARNLARGIGRVDRGGDLQL